MKQLFTAKRKDGTPAQPGDRVLVIYDNGQKHFGSIKKVRGPMKFPSMKFVMLQTYDMRTNEGKVRPAHAWHIKQVFLTQQKRKPYGSSKFKSGRN